MTGDRWQRLTRLFEQALEQPASGRDAFVAAACAGDDAMRAELGRLLAAHERLGRFLDESPGAAARAVAAGDDSTPAAGRQVGPWRILREIGHGGMGTVYLAERADRQFDRRIALKLIRRGLDSDLVLRRFRTERQILASLDHPNIARLYDGGTTDDGLPYFAMEHIEGDPIDRWCQDRRLGVSGRLELFRQVCDAVAYAHRRLVVHRDLKPSNVMVTAEGAAKLLDFGLARLLRSDGEDGDTRTLPGMLILTPEYASPEQLDGRPATTLSDVYSLGVMLYELLSGRHPFTFPARSIPEVLRVLNAAEPRRPSTVAVAVAGGEDLERLRRRLRGDLDTIVLKAMHRDPERRYASAEQLAEDLRRHQEGLPVIARPDTVTYRMGKFARRNRAAVVGASLIVLTLIAGVVATTWQARRAREAQARAERRFADLRALAHAVLFDYHDAIKDLAGSTPVRQRLVTDGLAYLDALGRDAAGDPGLQRERAAAYDRLGDVQGGTMFSNLGDTRGALDSYGKAHAIYAALLARDSSDAVARRGWAHNRIRTATLLWETGDLHAALEDCRAAIPVLEPMVAAAPADRELLGLLLRALDTHGMLLLDAGEMRAAIAQHTRQRERVEQALAGDPGSPELRRGLAVATDHLAAAHLRLGEYATALEFNRRTIDVRARLAAEFPLNADHRRSLAVSYYNDGEILTQLGRLREALASYRQDLAIVEELSRADPRNELFRGDRAYGLVRVGDMEVELRRPAEAATHYRASLAIRQADVDADPENVWKRASLIEAHAKLALTLARGGGAEAADHDARAGRWIERTPLDSAEVNLRIFFAQTWADLGEARVRLAASAPAPEARRHWREALDRYRKSEALWRELSARNALPPSESERPSRTAAAIRRCEAALDR